MLFCTGIDQIKISFLLSDYILCVFSKVFFFFYSGPVEQTKRNQRVETWVIWHKKKTKTKQHCNKSAKKKFFFFSLVYKRMPLYAWYRRIALFEVCAVSAPSRQRPTQISSIRRILFPSSFEALYGLLLPASLIQIRFKKHLILRWIKFRIFENPRHPGKRTKQA